MDLTFYCPCPEEQQYIFAILDTKGYIQIEEYTEGIMIFHTSVAMQSEIKEGLLKCNIFVGVAEPRTDDRCAIECTLCEGDMANARNLPRGHVFCDQCIKKWMERNNNCPQCPEPPVLLEFAALSESLLYAPSAEA